MESPDPSQNTSGPARSGVYVTAGMNLRIANLRLHFSEDGEVSSDIRLEVSLDVFPHWMSIALEHARHLHDANKRLLVVWSQADENAVHGALEAEFLAAMQAITASAIAWDGLFGTLRRYVTLPDDLLTSWRSNRTARSARVLEVVRRSCRIGNKSTQELGHILRDTYKWRGWSVHPPASFTAPVQHPDLHIHTEWRFAGFRLHNAHHIVRALISAIPQLLTRPRLESSEFKDFCKAMQPRMRHLVETGEPVLGVLISGQARELLGLAPVGPVVDNEV